MFFYLEGFWQYFYISSFWATWQSQFFYEWPDLPIKTCLNLPHSLWVLKFATQIPPLLVWSWKHWNLPLPFCIVPTPFYSIANAIPSHLSTVLGMIGLSPLFLGFTELWSLANLILVHGPDKARQCGILSCYLPPPLPSMAVWWTYCKDFQLFYGKSSTS